MAFTFWSRKILISAITGRKNGTFFPTDTHYLPLASTMAWVENVLNYTNSYYKITSSEGDQLDRFEYLVPVPLGYTSTMNVHWTTDVVVLNPSCSWQTATTPGLVNSTWEVTLPESNLGISLRNDSFGMFLLSSNIFICLLNFSIEPWLCAGERCTVLQQKCYRIHHSCGRFRTFGHG